MIHADKNGKFITHDRQGRKVVISWEKIPMLSPVFHEQMVNVSELGCNSFLSVELQFLRNYPDVVMEDEYFKPLRHLFEKGSKQTDWGQVQSILSSMLDNIFKTDYSKMGEEVTKNFVHDNYYFVKANNPTSGTLIGFITFLIKPDYAPGTLKVTSMAVLSSEQNRGLGKILMSSIFKIKEDTSRIFLCTRITNEYALKAYRSWGFTKDPHPLQDPHYTFNLKHWIFMEYLANKNNLLQEIAKKFGNGSASDNWDAKFYKEHSNVQMGGALAALTNYPFKGNESILDIGCGDGKITIEMARKVPDGRVIGLDLSPNMIKEANNTLSKYNITNTLFEIGDAVNFNYADQFDLIVSFFAFHYIKDQHKALSNVYNALKKNGIFILRMSGGNNQEIAEVFEYEHWKNKFGNKEVEWYSNDENSFRKMLLEVGFKNMQVNTYHDSHFYDNYKQLLDWIMAWVPHVTGLQHDEALLLAQEIADNIKNKQQGQKGSKIEVKSPLLYVWAKK